MAQGGFYKAPGTLIIGHTQGNASAILVPFVISQSTVYVLEFTNNLIRVWKNGVHNIVAIPDIVTTYTAAEIADIQVFPFFPDLFIAHQNHAPARIHWTTPDTLVLAALTYNTATITFTGTSVNGANTITGVPTNLLPTESIWFLTGPGIVAGTYLNSVVATPNSSPVTYTTTMSANAGVGAGAGTFTLTLQPIPFGSVGNYPRAVCVAFQRLWFLNTVNQPQTVWESIVGIWDATDTTHTIVGMAWSDISQYAVATLQQNADGTPTTNPPTYLSINQFQDQVNDGDAGSYTFNSDKTDELYWMLNAIDFLVGSSSGEWIVPGTSNPNTIQANKISSITDFPVAPTLVNGGIIFIQKLGRRVYRMEWQGANNPFQTPQDLTFFSGHLFANNPILDYDVQLTPDCLIWYLRTDGTLAVLLYNPIFGVQAWWNYVMQDAVVLSLCVVPGIDFQGITDRDIVYLAVRRGTSVFIEQVATPFWTDNRQAIFSHHATYRFNAVPFTTMNVDTGLNGQTVEVVVDGAYIGTAIVTAGVVTLPGGKSANYAVAGINYSSLMTTMPLVPQPQEGTGQLKKASIPKARMRLYNTLYLRVGQFTTPNASGNVPTTSVRIPMEGPQTDYTKANPVMYSGYARASILEALRDDAYLSVVSDLPLPCAVTAIVPDVEVSEG